MTILLPRHLPGSQRKGFWRDASRSMSWEPRYGTVCDQADVSPDSKPSENGNP